MATDAPPRVTLMGKNTNDIGRQDPRKAKTKVGIHSRWTIVDGYVPTWRIFRKEINILCLCPKSHIDNIDIDAFVLLITTRVSIRSILNQQWILLNLAFITAALPNGEIYAGLMWIISNGEGPALHFWAVIDLQQHWKDEKCDWIVHLSIESGEGW